MTLRYYVKIEELRVNFLIANIIANVMADNRLKAEFFYKSGLLLYDEGFYLKAERKFDLAIKYDQDNPFYHYNKSRALFMLKMEKEGHEEIDTAIKLFIKEITNNPHEPKYHDGIAYAHHFLVENFVMSVEEFQDLGFELSDFQLNYNIEGVIGRMVLVFKRVKDEVETAINLDPGNLEYRLHKINFLLYLTRMLNSDYSCEYEIYFKKDPLYDEAMQECHKILQLDAKNVEAIKYEGIILSNNRKREEALVKFNEALDISPKNIELLYHKSETLYYLKRYEDSINILNEIITFDPRYTDAIEMKGLNLMSLERYEEAMKEFDALISINPEHYLAMIYKGDCLMKTNRDSEALEAYEKAVEIAPYSIMAFKRKAFMLNKMGKKEELSKELTRAFNVNSCGFVREIN